MKFDLMLSEFQNMKKFFGENKPMTYLGDAVYASHDGYQFHLATANGLEVTNEVYIEPKVLQHLILFAKYIDPSVLTDVLWSDSNANK